jgi:hypothetical protein
MKCYCQVIIGAMKDKVEFCPMHKAAPDMLEACLWALQNGAMLLDKGTLDKLRNAINKAEGK